MYNQQLETFIRVVEAGSFSKAAQAIFITPTAVIKQINLLESSLDLQLFIRTHRGLILTEAGRSLYQDARYIIQYSKDSVIRAKNAMEETSQVIRIGSSPMTPGQFLIELWPKIHKHCPEIKFQMIQFENTPENAREILRNLGQNIDIVPGLFDHTIVKRRGCEATELSKLPIRAAVSIHHRLASKDSLTVADLHDENLMLIQRGWNGHMDLLRDGLQQKHPQIKIVDFEFYNLSVFNECENGNQVLMTVDIWKQVHPLLKVIPVEWEYQIPFGILYSPEPSETVRHFLNAVRLVIDQKE